MRGTIIVTVALFAAFCVSGTVESCFKMITDEKLVEQSDIIVTGEITEVAQGGKGRADKSIATIKVNSVLKGEKDLKTVKLAYPSENRSMRRSTDIFYKKGQKGIWLLKKAVDKDYYVARYPGRFKPIDKLDAIKAIIEQQGKEAAKEQDVPKVKSGFIIRKGE